MFYYHTNCGDGTESLALIFTDDGTAETVTITRTHPNFDPILTYLNTTEDIDEHHVRRLANFGAEAGHHLRQLSARITYQHGAIYFDGDRIDTTLTRHIVRMIRDGDQDYLRFVRFLDNLAANPSRLSRMHLYRWLQDRDFTITSAGHFIGYKGVQNTPDNRSISSGRATVNGQVHAGTIPNPIGGTIEMPRSEVNPNRDEGCSTGLHVGTWSYASSFGRGRVLTVAVNPRDVVSVPRDCDSQKLRCCRYEVIAAATAPHTGTAYDAADEVDPFDDADDDFLVA